MADKLLKSITFPDLTDKYIIGDTSLSVAGAGADSKTVGDALATKAEVDGSYESMTVGNAEQLVSNVRVNDKTPYLFRTSGGSVDIGDREYVNGIVGGTVAWNQMVSLATIRETRTIQGVQFTNNNNGTITLNGTATGTANAGEWNVLGLPTDHVCLYTFIDTDSKLKWTMGKYPSNASDQGTIKIVSGNTYNITFYPQSFDLTQMFGSTIADYIYSLETATAGAGVAWFKKLFPKPYYEYNAGELMSVQASSHDMVGFNQWDEEWEVGTINTGSGQNETNGNYFRSKNYIQVLPNTTYYYKTSDDVVYVFYYDADRNYLGYETVKDGTKTTNANAHYLRFVDVTRNSYSASSKPICINLSWDGSRNGEYEPYELHSYPLDSDLTLRGIPKLDANNNLYYDGDTYEADGTVTRKYGIVDLGTLAYGYNSSYGFYCSTPSYMKNPNNNYAFANIACSKYSTQTVAHVVDGSTDKAIAVGAYIYIADSAYTDAQTFKTAMSGVYLVYELATPTTETADPYQQTQIVNDFGTEEYVIGSNTFAVPVGSDIDYPVNLVAKLEMAPNSPEGDGTYVVKQTNGMNEYVPLIIPSGIPSVPTTDGTYTLTVTVTDGTPVLSWEA